MARRRKGKKKGVSSGRLFTRAERELAKGNVRSALKDAKRCYREDASHDHRQLLERAYLRRADQLVRMNLPTEARAVLAELDELGVTQSEVEAQIPRLKMLLGEVDAGQRAELLQQDPHLLAELADSAVIDQRTNVDHFPEIKDCVARVREALLAVERGDDEGAAECLKQIPRKSVLSDWLYFVRGLSAHYQGDRERMAENWRRLDTGRPAHRISLTLQVARGELSAEEAPIDLTSSLAKLKSRRESHPTRQLLEQLAACWNDGTWNNLPKLVREFRARYGKKHPELLEAIVDLVEKRAVKEGDSWLLDRLKAIAPVPSLDPRWNRARAMLAEHPQYGDCDDEERYSEAYADDLRELKSLREDERQIAAGLVYLRLARHWIHYAAESLQGGMFARPDEDQAMAFSDRAEEFFHRSIAEYPQNPVVYRELAEFYERADNLDGAAKQYKFLVALDAHDFDSNRWLATYFLVRDEPQNSEPYMKAVLRLKPRDPSTQTLVWNQHITTVRGCAKKKMFEAARQELAKAAELPGLTIEPYTLDILRASIEYKAKDLDKAERFLAAAQSHVEEPTAIWMQMSCSAARFSLPRNVKKQFDGRFKKAIEFVPTGETAGRLARFAISLHGNQVRYTGRATQEKLFKKYLLRAVDRRIDWHSRDLSNVCDYLMLDPKNRRLCEGFAGQGVNNFPTNPWFHLYLGLIDFDDGPYACDLHSTKEHLEAALKYKHQGDTPLQEGMIERAEHALRMMQDYIEQEAHYGSGFSDDGYDEDDDDEDFDEYDPYDVDDETHSGMDPMASRQIIEQVIQQGPAAMQAIIEQMAEEAGVSPMEIMGNVLNSVGALDSGNPMEPERTGKSGSSKSKRQKSKSKR